MGQLELLFEEVESYELGVDESQVSCDERNEYHGVSVERASRILDSLAADLRCIVATDDGGTRAPTPAKHPPRVNFGSHPDGVSPDEVGQLMSTWRAQA